MKELPESELVDTTDKKEIEQDEKYNLVQAAKLLAGNKYYMMICITYILQQIYGAMISMGTYYATYILGNRESVRCILLGNQHSSDHRTGVHPDLGCKVEWNV